MEVAKKLTVSHQSLSQTLNAVDIKTGFIEKLANLYNLPIGYFFGEDPQPTQAINGNGNHQQAGRDAIQLNIPHQEHEELIRLREELRMMKEIVAEKDARIEDLKQLLQARFN